LALLETQQLVLASSQLQFQQRLLLQLQFSLQLLSLQVPSSQLLSSPLSLLAFLHFHLLQPFWVQPSSRPSSLALALQVEHRASTHRVRHERERGRLVAQ
jgi:uncharacterized membrane protein YGL010W